MIIGSPPHSFGGWKLRVTSTGHPGLALGLEKVGLISNARETQCPEYNYVRGAGVDHI